MWLDSHVNKQSIHTQLSLAAATAELGHLAVPTLVVSHGYSGLRQTAPPYGSESQLSLVFFS